MNLRTDERLGSYTLESTIGKGAAGVVWSATSPDHTESVAIKILRDDLTDDPEVVARFLQEQQIFDSVDHPNVVKVHDLIAEDRLGIVMELLEDGDLRSLIASGELTVPDVVDIAIQVADGLAHIHDVGVLHRDLKPANVLVGGSAGDRAVKISDFGVSKLVGQNMTRTSTTIGTPLYMAPEVTGSRGAGMSSDVYALGAMLYEMLVGSPPFHGDGTLAIILAHSQSPVPELRGVPTEVAALVAEMLHKDPNLRPSASEVSSRLTAVVPLLDNSMTPFATSPFEPVDISPVHEPANGLFAERSAGVFDEIEEVEAFSGAHADEEGGTHKRLHESRLRTIAVPPDVEATSEDEPWPVAVGHPSSGPSALTNLVSRRLGTVVVSAVALVALFALALVLVNDDSSEVVAESDAELAAGPDRANGAESISNSRQAGSQSGTAPSEASSSSAVRSGSEAAASSDSDSSNRASSDRASATRGSTNAAASGSESTSSVAASRSTSKAATPKKGAATRKGASGEKPATTTTDRPRSSSTAVKPVVATDEPEAEDPTTTATTSKTTEQLSTTTSTTEAASKVATTEKATTTTTTAPASVVAPPTSKASLVSTSTTAEPTTTTAAPVASKQVAIVSGPSVVSVSGTSAIFRYTTNPVCATGSFTFRNQSTGAVVGRWVGDRGCFGPVHDGSTAWPNIVLEPGTTYSVSILLEGQPSDGTLATGTGRASSSIVITTPG